MRVIRDYYAPGGTVPLHRKGDIEILEPWMARAFIANGIAKRIPWKKNELLLARPVENSEMPRIPKPKRPVVATRPSHLTEDQLDGLKRMYLAGYSVRSASMECRVTKRTASRFYQRFRATFGPVTCQCGQLATHLGWCNWRLAQSQSRQRYLSGRTNEELKS